MSANSCYQERPLFSSPTVPLLVSGFLYLKHCNCLQLPATACNCLQLPATACLALPRTTAHQSALQRTAAHCNTLQHTVTHCNALHRTATHYNVVIEPCCVPVGVCILLPWDTAIACNCLQHTAAHCNIVFKPNSSLAGISSLRMLYRVYE